MIVDESFPFPENDELVVYMMIYRLAYINFTLATSITLDI